MQQQAKQGVAAAFAAGEHSDLLEHVIFGKQKTAEQAAEFSLRGARGRVAQIVDHPRVSIEFFVLILGEVVSLNVVAEAEFAMRCPFGARQKLDQCRFAGAVHADESDSIAALDQEVDIAEDLFFAAAGFGIALGHFLELGYDPATGLGLREREVNRLFFRRDLDALDLFQLLDATLHLLGLGGLVAKAVDEYFELLDAVTL